MEEQFDLYDAQGLPTGERKSRSQVHRDGDWHRSIHLWVIRGDGSLVLQQRAFTKDTMPGLLTATVSGHFAAGEVLADVLREAQEEVGRPVAEDQLIAIGVWRYENIGSDRGVLDREWQEIFLWPNDLPLAEFRPTVREVSALVELSPSLLLALLLGHAARIPAVRMEAADLTCLHTTLWTANFVPMVDYHTAVARSAALFSIGQRPRL
jgi:isopentenyldiphosphate isomerase